MNLIFLVYAFYFFWKGSWIRVTTSIRNISVRWAMALFFAIIFLSACQGGPQLRQDAHLPDTNGIKIAKIIREDHPETKIVLITGYEHDLNIDQASEIEIPFFYKPLGEHDLREILTHFEERKPFSSFQPGDGREKQNFLDRGLNSIGERMPIEQTILLILDELSEISGNTSMAVFSLDIQKSEVRLLAGKNTQELTNEHIHNFIYSQS